MPGLYLSCEQPTYMKESREEVEGIVKCERIIIRKTQREEEREIRASTCMSMLSRSCLGEINYKTDIYMKLWSSS